MTKNILLTEIKRKDMVSHNEIYPVIRAIWNLSVLHFLAIGASGFVPVLKSNVKGKDGLIDNLSAIQLALTALSREKGDIADIRSEIQQWIKTLDSEYGDPKARFNTKSVILLRNHAQPLEKDSVKWFEKIYSIYEKPNTKLLNQKEFGKIAQELSKKLDNMQSLDLHDGYECLLNNIPTPGAMILYRVGESMVQKFYAKEMGHEPPEGSTMGMMAAELREKQRKEIESGTTKKADPLVNYIIVQTEERNLAQHPERRFDQTEAEEVFIFVKKLINDIHERLEKK